MALTMIDPTSSWFKMVELPLVTWLWRQTVDGKELLTADEIFDQTSDCMARLVNKIWLCRYPQSCYLMYDNGSEFKLHFEYLIDWEIKDAQYVIFGKPILLTN
jgi:hypothetical protein